MNMPDKQLIVFIPSLFPSILNRGTHLTYTSNLRRICNRFSETIYMDVDVTLFTKRSDSYSARTAERLADFLEKANNNRIVRVVNKISCCAQTDIGILKKYFFTTKDISCPLWIVVGGWTHASTFLSLTRISLPKKNMQEVRYVLEESKGKAYKISLDRQTFIGVFREISTCSQRIQ